MSLPFSGEGETEGGSDFVSSIYCNTMSESVYIIFNVCEELH